MFPFLSLPREIRNTIYRLSLEVGFIDPHFDSNDYTTLWHNDVPTLALLAVNKRIRAEARPIFYRTNIWQIAIEPNKQTLFHKVEPWFFENLVIVLSGDDGPHLDRMSTAGNVYSTSDDEIFGPNATLTEHEKREVRWELIHREYLEDVLLAWNAKVELLLEDLPYAKSVIVDFGKLHCPAGCCRLPVFEEAPIRRLLESLRREDSAFVHGRPQTTFSGLLAKAERTLLFDGYGFGEECDIDYGSDDSVTTRSGSDNGSSDQEEEHDDEEGEPEVPESDDDQEESAENEDQVDKPIRLLSAADVEQSTPNENHYTETEAPYDSEALEGVMKYDYEVLRKEARKRLKPISG